jgi:hypothetical protein
MINKILLEEYFEDIYLMNYLINEKIIEQIIGLNYFYLFAFSIQRDNDCLKI